MSFIVLNCSRSYIVNIDRDNTIQVESLVRYRNDDNQKYNETTYRSIEKHMNIIRKVFMSSIVFNCSRSFIVNIDRDNTIQVESFVRYRNDDNLKI